MKVERKREGEMGEMIPNLFKIRWEQKRVKILDKGKDQRNVVEK